MIPLALPAQGEMSQPFVTRLVAGKAAGAKESERRFADGARSLWAGVGGLFEVVDGGADLAGDVVLVDPLAGRAERIIRANSPHNTLLVTEQCDQLCLMCSQPPKKSHRDRFGLFTEACLLAPQGMTIGISGGEPTLHMEPLLAMLEQVLAKRDDLSFHILSNGQHFTREHALRLRHTRYRKAVWGIPLYSAAPVVHDEIVAKPGAYERLMQSFEHLMVAGARIELRTVMMAPNLEGLGRLARFVTSNLPQIEQWSLMGLENIGYARNRWQELAVRLPADFAPVAAALDWALLHGIPARLFNVPLCQVPEAYRTLAVASISDWKQRFAATCSVCRARSECSGFFEWHPDDLVNEARPL